MEYNLSREGKFFQKFGHSLHFPTPRQSSFSIFRPCEEENSEDISDVMSTVTQSLWLAKSHQTKEMTKNSGSSNDCRFTYMLDFILKPGGKLVYQDNASLLKFKGNSSIYRHLPKIALEIRP